MDPEIIFQQCVNDYAEQLALYGKANQNELCNAFEYYAAECSKFNPNIEWRKLNRCRKFYFLYPFLTNFNRKLKIKF